MNEDGVRIGYAVGDDGAVTRALSHGLGVLRNVVVRGGYAYHFFEGASAFVEPMRFSTEHKIEGPLAETTDSVRETAGVEVGAVYRF
ncbi:MAG: hypothetical protein AAGA56_29865 [Myxococcota bacterium]